MGRLQRSFFAQPTLTVARELLGSQLVKLDESGDRLAGTIVEVEAYIGSTDQACHARYGCTQRNQVMYGKPGTSYVYLIYGIHWMLNIVTESDWFPAAVLLRSVIPTDGLGSMRRRRPRNDAELANGPAKLTQAFGIGSSWNGYDMCLPEACLFLEEAPGIRYAHDTGTRIGIGQAPEPWRSLPWNYRLRQE